LTDTSRSGLINLNTETNGGQHRSSARSTVSLSDLDKSSMRVSLSTLLVATFGVGLAVLTLAMIGRQPLWQIDFQAVTKYTFPSESGWDEILLAHANEIQDGSRDPKILNYEFVTGWQICVYYFCNYPSNNPNFPWDYEWILNNRPWEHLGGPMQDTIRVSRSTGRKHASAMLKGQLNTKSNEELRGEFYKFNNGYLGLAAGYILLAGFGIFQHSKNRRITM